MALTGLEVFERGTLPRWVRVRQTLDETVEPDVAAAVAREFAKPGIGDAIMAGTTIALTAGSRGVDKIDVILRACVDEIKARGATAFIVPAMGSHGGATVPGQLSILEHYGITEAAMGCEVRASMETVLLGHVHGPAGDGAHGGTDGAHGGTPLRAGEGDVPVYFDKTAYEQADMVIPVARIKPHTDFVGTVESGMMKMLAIGLGKQKGAEYFHARGFKVFHELIPAVGQFTLSKVNIPFGIATVENGHSHCSLIEALPAASMLTREAELLDVARARMGRLPEVDLDVLIIDKIGKDISGDGADPNVINRDCAGVVDREAMGFRPRIQRVLMRDLTDDTEGNATGIGMADVCLRRLADKIDPVKTYMNCITSKSPAGARTPITLDTDRQALHIAIVSGLETEVETARIARIESTKHVEELWVSEPLLAEMLATGKVEVLNEPGPIVFDEAGMLVD